MNELIPALAQLCRRHLLEEKLLLCTSLRVGHQWLDSVARLGQPLVNCRVATMKSLALELAGPELAARGFRPLTERGGIVVMHRLWSRLRPRGSGYLSSLPEDFGLARALGRSLQDLRLAGFKASSLKASCFEDPAKGSELALLLKSWPEELKRLGLADYPLILALATERIKLQPAVLRGLVIVPPDLELAFLEEGLLSLLPEGRRITVKPQPPERAPGEKCPGGISFQGAVGEINEVRQVLRRCLEEGASLDDVELLHTDTGTYVPLIFETLHRAVPGEVIGPEELPATFAEGIPVSYSRPGRALRAWLEWIRSDYRQPILVRMIEDGLLLIPGMAEAGVGFTALAGVLKTMGIGFGRENYLEKISLYRRRLLDEAEQPAAPEDEADEAAAPRRDLIARRVACLDLIAALVGRLLDLCPAPRSGPEEALAAADSFLEGFARSLNRFDNFAREALREAIEDLGLWLGAPPSPGQKAAPGTPWDVVAWLSALPGEVRVMGSGPRPGCLHVAHLLAGGHSGRGRVFILGLDDRRFPGAGLQDPILLDGERMKLSPRLETASRNLARKLESFRGLLSRLDGPVSLSYSRRCLDDNREQFPSPALLDVFRRLTDDLQADQGRFLGSLPPPASFAPDSPARALDEAEWWLWRLTGPEAAGAPLEAVARRYPHLGRGLLASGRRRSPDFTEYDGHVPEAGPDADPTSAQGPVVSPSRLETLAACPLRYYFKYILELEPPEELILQPDRWLDPLQYGSLMHEIFHRFMLEIIAAGRVPSASQDGPLMDGIVKKFVRAYRERYPPLSQTVFRDQERRLRRACRVFLVEEESFYRQARPLYAEASFGLPSEEPTAFDSEAPMPVSLPGGVIRVRGRIDRIDRIGQGENFVVTDYKSGGIFKYRKSPPFWQGRVVQHALYLTIAEARLREMGHRGARVERFRYFFPDRWNRGEEISYTPESLADAGRVIESLCRLLAGGAFPATDNPGEDCGLCDYRAICGSTVEGAEPRLKIENPGNAALEPFRRLRGSADGSGGEEAP